ncbi:hypothetical protein NGRA_0738 [Nosema granulosis]|uniref:Uncharacterized protein n=1 Tax=Nosema granulosis TaxID=83296 RepID=A0A9P6H0T6_9MICR|nr:hypothetical protein NGRA_0738 [Nosema granulosis]
MPIIDLLFSFTKKNNQVLSAFMDSWRNVRDMKNVPFNLERMYECIAYEHSKQINYKCTEYFIEKELFFSILKLSKIGYKTDVNNFLIKLISELDKKNLNELQNSIDSVFSECSKEYLGISLAYSERIVVHDLEISEGFLDYILKFVFEGGIEGEYARASLIYLLSNKRTCDILEIKGFILKIVNSLNYLYDDIYSNIELYKTIVELLCLYLAKEKTIERVAPVKRCYVGNSSPQKQYDHNEITLLSLRSTNDHQVEDLNMNKESILRTLNLTYKDIVIYRQILESNVIDLITRAIIEEFLSNLENKEEHIDFIRYLIRKHPKSLACYFVTQKYNDWNVYDVFEKIVSNIKETKPLSFTCVKNNTHVNRSMIDKIIDLKIVDEDVYLFLFLASKESFYSRFGEIYNLMKDSNTFFGTLYRLIIS